MRQKLIAQAVAFGCSLHQSSDVEDSQDGRSDFLRLEEICELLKTCIFDVDEGSIWIDGTERSVLDWDVEIGEEVESAAFADVGHAE